MTRLLLICPTDEGTTACSWDEIIPFEPLWENYKRLIKDRGAVVLFGSQPFTSKLIMSNFDWFKYELIWEKTNASDFTMAHKRPRKLHENIAVFSDGQTCYNPQFVAGTPYKDKPRARTNNIIASSMPNLGIDNDGYRFPPSIYKVSNGNNGVLHPTQKPVALLSYLIRTYTNKGEIILDNTMGSGTALVAAQTEGRQAVGIEISEAYCKIAVDRLKQPSFWSLPTVTTPPKAKQKVLF